MAPLKRQVRTRIRRFELLSSAGLWALALFSILSMGAYRDFDMLPTFGAGVRKLLGSGPPVMLINWALIIYGFSALVLILIQMASNKRPRCSLLHLFYLGAFFFFYHFSNGLDENFWALFTVGLTILGLQSYHFWHYYQEQIDEQKEILEELIRLEKDL